MNIETIVSKLEEMCVRFKDEGLLIGSNFSNTGHRVEISRDNIKTVIRDSYDNGKISITSFDVLLTVDDITYLYYVSDYPSEEYIDRLKDVEEVLRNLFAYNFSVSTERYLIFWKRKYIKVQYYDEYLSFIKTRSKGVNQAVLSQL